VRVLGGQPVIPKERCRLCASIEPTNGFERCQRRSTCTPPRARAYIADVVYQVLATPLTYEVVGWLKRVEQADAFDQNASFDPFAQSSG
jgi:hypothetical protein